MTITKENAKELGRKGGITQGQNRRSGVTKMLKFLEEDGSERISAIFTKLLNDEPLTDGEKEFKKDYKELLEFHTPKRARVDEKGDTANNDITIKIERDYGDSSTA